MTKIYVITLTGAMGTTLSTLTGRRINYFVAVKEALGNVRGKIGVEFDHLSLENYG